MTKHPPAMPIKSLSTASPVAEFTSPVHAVGIDAAHKMVVNKTLAPYLSHKRPIMLVSLMFIEFDEEELLCISCERSVEEM